MPGLWSVLLGIRPALQRAMTSGAGVLRSAESLTRGLLDDVGQLVRQRRDAGVPAVEPPVEGPRALRVDRESAAGIEDLSGCVQGSQPRLRVRAVDGHVPQRREERRQRAAAPCSHVSVSAASPMLEYAMKR